MVEKNKLFEQIFNKTNRIFYHMSPYKFDQFKLSSEYMPGMEEERKVPSIFLSPSKDFVIKFLEYKPDVKESQKVVYLYTVMLTRELNLWNESSKFDQKRFKETFPDEYEMYMHKRKQNRRVARRDFVRIEEYAFIYKELGYDGYNTLGIYSDFNPLNAENIAVFDASALRIIKREEIDTSKYQYKHIKIHSDLRNLIKKYKKDEYSFYIPKLKMLGYTDEEIHKNASSTNFQIESGNLKSLEKYRWEIKNSDAIDPEDVEHRLRKVYQFNDDEIKEFMSSI